VPDREALRALYDAAVAEINATRGNLLTTDFYRKIGDAVFAACYSALSDHSAGKRRMHTVAAPPGTGKTSFSLAFIIAMTRYAEQHPEAPYGCVFLTDRSKRAEEVYRELDALLPSKVAIWTKEHDHLFSREALRQYPAVVVNNQFYLNSNGHRARNVNNRGHLQNRALTIVDERPQNVATYEIMLWEAQRVRDELQERHPEAKKFIDGLLRLMERYSYEPSNKIYLPEDMSDQLAWFNGPQAERLAALKIANVDQLFGFAKALVQGCGFVVSESKLVRYVGYASKLTEILSAGTVLLDATADIDGVSHIVPWRVALDVPQARYDNLEIIHVPQHTTKHLKNYFGTAPNQKAYVRWMVHTIMEHMKPNERGLVICKKKLIDEQRVPSWPDDDKRFEDKAGFTAEYAWKIEGRNLCVIHWGTGIGDNAWKGADVIFLCDEFHLPRRTAIANVQGLREHKVNEGDLASMKTLNSRAPAVDIFALGHRLRWLKQMALRGRARCYDENGVCGKQRLVVACDLGPFMANVGKLFPGATVRTTAHAGDSGKWAERVITILNGSMASTITTSELGELLGKAWRSVRFAVLTSEFFSALDGMGWRYVPSRGRGGGRFERMMPNEALAA
jgi:hypothetical protein